jgi:DNA-binding transcriptional LysR family regulator
VNLKRLQAFRAVFEAASVTRAAERLHTTQPAVSRLIGDLEAELGLALFVRQKRRLAPTAEGRAFYHEAEKGAGGSGSDCRHRARHPHPPGSPSASRGADAHGFRHTACGGRRFSSRSSTCARVVGIKDIRDIADWVANGPFDIGVTALPFEDARVECEPLATVPAVLVMPARHRLAAKRVVHANDLRGESLILPLGNPVRAQVCAPLEAAGLKIESMIDASSALLVCQLVAQGLGVGVLDPFTFKLASGLVIVSRPLRPAPEFLFGLFFPRHRPRSALVKAFVGAVRSVVGSPPVRSVRKHS